MLEPHLWGNSNKHPKQMTYEEIRIKQDLSYISISSLSILYNSGFILIATSSGENAVVVTRIHCINWLLFTPAIQLFEFATIVFVCTRPPGSWEPFSNIFRKTLWSELSVERNQAFRLNTSVFLFFFFFFVFFFFWFGKMLVLVVLVELIHKVVLLVEKCIIDVVECPSNVRVTVKQWELYFASKLLNVFQYLWNETY